MAQGGAGGDGGRPGGAGRVHAAAGAARVAGPQRAGGMRGEGQRGAPLARPRLGHDLPKKGLGVRGQD